MNIRILVVNLHLKMSSTIIFLCFSNKLFHCRDVLIRISYCFQSRDSQGNLIGLAFVFDMIGIIVALPLVVASVLGAASRFPSHRIPTSVGSRGRESVVSLLQKPPRLRLFRQSPGSLYTMPSELGRAWEGCHYRGRRRQNIFSAPRDPSHIPSR